jgi:hypothetical protein
MVTEREGCASTSFGALLADHVVDIGRREIIGDDIAVCCLQARLLQPPPQNLR